MNRINGFDGAIASFQDRTGLNRLALHKRLALGQNHVSDLMVLRATAKRLVAKGNHKAAGVVREINAKLFEIQRDADTLSCVYLDQGEVAVILKIDVTHAVYGLGRKRSYNLKEQAQGLVASLSDKEARVADLYLQFCLELTAWVGDAVQGNQPLRRLEMQQALNYISTAIFDTLQGSGVRITEASIDSASLTPWPLI